MRIPSRLSIHCCSIKGWTIWLLREGGGEGVEDFEKKQEKSRLISSKSYRLSTGKKVSVLFCSGEKFLH